MLPASVAKGVFVINSLSTNLVQAYFYTSIFSLKHEFLIILVKCITII